MKNILIFFYDWEVNSDSTNSMARLLAFVIKELEGIYEINFFSFSQNYFDKAINTKPGYLEIKKIERIKQKLTNFFFKKKRIKEFHLKQHAARNFVKSENKNYDAIIVLGLDEVDFLRTNFPSAKIIYWIHGVSAIYKKEYLQHINKTDYLWCPTKGGYKKIIDLLYPKPFLGEFQLIPNWASDEFNVENISLTEQLKLQHKILTKEKIFIFCGGETKMKGLFVINKIFKHFPEIDSFAIAIIITGGNKQNDLNISQNVRVIYAGNVSPKILAAYYSLANYGLFPSVSHDHAPLTLLEMIKCNVLPLVSDVGGVKEILGDTYKFLIECPHYIKEWREKTIALLSTEEAERMKLLMNLKNRLQNYRRVDFINVMENILD